MAPNQTQQRQSVKEFAAQWKNKGYEKGESQTNREVDNSSSQINVGQFWIHRLIMLMAGMIYLILLCSLMEIVTFAI